MYAIALGKGGAPSYTWAPMTRTKVPPLAPVLQRLSKSGASYDEQRLHEAFAVAKESYTDSMHWTGVTVLDHALGVLQELASFEPDEDTVVACLLHHVLEEKAMTLAELEQQFGVKVRSLVSGTHLLSHVTLEGRRRSIEDLRIMLLSVSDDIRVLFLCLCDRAYNLQFADRVDPAVAKQLCQDVLQLFAPVAARLGIYTLKHKLESRAFPVLYPADSERISEQLHTVHNEHPSFLKRAQHALEQFLERQGIEARVDGREKQSFSIFQKMHGKSLSHIGSIYDLFALRVIVRSEEDCYRVLGLLHRLGRPLPNRFKDYIAFPKPNGYQSLHTTLAGFADLPDECYMEVQIRTEAMHREALYGVAAHWSYKENGATEQALQKVQLHSMLMSQASVDNNEDDSTSLADHIFVLTPQGDIIELPEGATPLDFAFQIHSDLGLMFRGAKVNGSIVPLNYELENGDVIEVQKHSAPQPSAHWMNVLKMASSKSRLRRYLYTQDRSKLIAMGKELVNAELKKRGFPTLTTDLAILRECDGETLSLAQREDLLMKIGQGAERASSLFHRLKAFETPAEEQAKQIPVKTGDSFKRHDTLVAVEGGIQMPTRYAKCCCPQDWPRENIVGNINRDGAVMVHRHHCRMFQNTNPERRIKVWWK